MKKVLFILFLFIQYQNIFSQNIHIAKIDEITKLLERQDDTTRIVNLWATWCAPCVKEIPHFEELNQAYKNQKVKVYLVAVEDEIGKVKNFALKKNLQSRLWFLNETDANAWIPKIDSNWQGDIPVTLISNTAKAKKEFHMGDFSKEKLFAFVENFLK